MGVHLHAHSCKDCLKHLMSIHIQKEKKIFILLLDRKPTNYFANRKTASGHTPEDSEIKQKKAKLFCITKIWSLINKFVEKEWRYSEKVFLGRKAMTNLDSILKSRDITLPKKVHLVKGMVFSVVMYECESLTIKKAERQRIDTFELWC